MSDIQAKIIASGRQLIRPGLAALFTGAVAIGSAPIFVRLSEVGPSATAFWRFALALPVLWLWWTLEERNTTGSRPLAAHSGYRWLVAAGFFLTGDLVLWHWSINITTVANATLLVNCAPVFVSLVAWLFFHERFNWVFVVGLVLAVVGATLLVGSSFNLSTQHLFGDILSLLAAMFYAGYILSVKQLRGNFSTATIMTWVGTITCLALLPITLLSGESLIALSLSGWLVLLGLALFTHVGGQGLIAYALAHLPAAFSSVGLLLQPVVATILAWLLFAEAVAPIQALGGVIVLAGIVLARRGSRS